MKRSIRNLVSCLVGMVLISQLVSVGAKAADVIAAESTPVNVVAFGAKGDGATDDTKAIQAALNVSANVTIPDGTYLINAEISLQIKSNQTVTMSDNAVLKAIPTANGRSAVVNISGVSNSALRGGQIIGERIGHMGTTGEWGMGIQIQYNSNNITISNVTIRDCWGDGLYIGSPTGTSTLVSNIIIDNVICDNNRRQGLSITNASYITIKNSVFKNTNGTAPQAGIDIEPNLGQTTENITIINTRCTGNASSGILLAGLTATIRNVSIINSDCSNNYDSGIYAINTEGLQVSGGNIASNEYGFQIERDAANVSVTNVMIEANRSYGIALVGSSQSRGIENITVQGCSIFNSKYMGAIVDNADTTGYVRNIAFQSCAFYDNQLTRTQKYGIFVPSTAIVSNITLTNDCTFSGNTSATYKGSVTLLSSGSSAPNTADTTKPVITLTGSSAINLYVGDVYNEAGATALDDTDGSVTSNIITSGIVNTGAAGTYPITYNVSDATGNQAEALTRTVNVLPVSAKSIILSTNLLNMSQGETKTLTATISPVNASNKAVTWSSSNTAIATVNASGAVTGVGAGTTTITVKATDGGFSATCTVTVSAQSKVTGITLSSSNLSVKTYSSAALIAKILPTNAINQGVTWTSSNTRIAKVNSNGIVTGVSRGTATITVTSLDGNYTATAVVTVTKR